jgi:hypothetical protein
MGHLIEVAGQLSLKALGQILHGQRAYQTLAAVGVRGGRTASCDRI